MYNDWYCHDKTKINLNSLNCSDFHRNFENKAYKKEGIFYMGTFKKLAYELLPSSDKEVTAYDDMLSD